MAPKKSVSSFSGLPETRKFSWQSEHERKVLRRYCPELFVREDMEKQRLRKSKTAQSFRSTITEDTFDSGYIFDKRGSTRSRFSTTSRRSIASRRSMRSRRSIAGQDDFSSDSSSSEEGMVALATMDRRFSLSSQGTPKPKRRSVLEDSDARTQRLVFRKFADESGAIHRHRLLDALNLLGYTEDTIDKSLITKFANDVTGGKNGHKNLSYLEWAQFCELIDKEHTDGAMKYFREADLDGNGYLDKNEVTILLEHHGITVMPGVVSELLEEVGLETPGEVSAREFRILNHVIRTRGGFTKKETKKLLELFDRYDFNKNGKMDKYELDCLLSWLGLTADNEHRRLLHKEVLNELSKCQDGQCDEPEFLQLMRKFRELEIAEVSELFSRLDLTGIGFLDLEGIVALLLDLGFKMPRHEVVEECAASCGIHKGRTEFYYEDVLLIVRAYRESEGYLKSEIEDFKNVFDGHDDDKSGTIDEAELGSVLRGLGCPTDMDTIGLVFGEIDVDKSGYVDFDEFIKILRRFHEEELNRLQDIFQESDWDHNGLLDLKELKFLVASLGYHPTPEEARMVHDYGQRGASFQECVKLVNLFKEDNRRSFEENHGFSAKQVKRFLMKFHHLDWKRTGQVTASDLCALVVDQYPDLALNLGIKSDQLLKKLGVTNTHIKFPEFLQVMRLATDRSDLLHCEREHQAAKDADFSPSEVMDLRQVFRICDSDNSHFLDLSELHEFITKSMNVSAHVADCVISGFQESDTNGDNQLDFAEFILLMRKVIDEGFNVDLGMDESPSNKFRRLSCEVHEEKERHQPLLQRLISPTKFS
jgi:Ca2+-binding EF-hand superfamily protein